MGFNPSLTETATFWEALRFFVALVGILVSLVGVINSVRDLRVSGPLNQARMTLAWINFRASGAACLTQVGLMLQAANALSFSTNASQAVTIRTTAILLGMSVVLLVASTMNFFARRKVREQLERRMALGIPGI
jgi:hypothetical protein